MSNISGNGLAWMLLGVPAILGWLGYLLGWLLDPHLIMEVNPLMWAMYAAGGWYAFLIVCFGGVLGIAALASGF